MVFQADLTSAKDEAGKSFWRKLLNLPETIILVSDNGLMMKIMLMMNIMKIIKMIKI